MFQFKWRQGAITALKCFFSVLLLAMLMRNFPEGTDWQKYKIFGWGWLCAAIIGGFLQFIILGLRWRQTTFAWLGDPRPDFNSSRFSFVSMLWISAAISQILPGLVAGDGYRIAALRTGGLDFKAATASVVSDRLIGMVALTVLSIPGAALLIVHQLSVFWLMLAVAISGLFLWCLWRLAFIFEKFSPSKIKHFVQMFKIRFVTRKGALLLVLAALGHLISIYILWCLVGALDVNLPLLPLVLLFPLALFAAMLPISAGGWGVRELTLVGTLATFGAKSSDVLIASVFFGIINAGLAGLSALFIVASLMTAKGTKA